MIQKLYEHFSLEKKRPPPFSHKAIISVAILSSPEKRLSFGGIRQYFTNKFVYYQQQESHVLSSSLRACLKQDHFRLYQCRCPLSTGREEGVCGFSDRDIWKVQLPEAMLKVAKDELSKAIGFSLESHRQKNNTNPVCLNSIVLATLNCVLLQFCVFFKVQNVYLQDWFSRSAIISSLQLYLIDRTRSWHKLSLTSL